MLRVKGMIFRCIKIKYVELYVYVFGCIFPGKESIAFVIFSKGSMTQIGCNNHCVKSRIVCIKYCVETLKDYVLRKSRQNIIG